MELISRKRALQDSFFASHIFNWQQQGNPEEDDWDYEAGEYYDETIDASRFFSVEELKGEQQRKIAQFKNESDLMPIELKESSLGCLVLDSPANEGAQYCTGILGELLECYALELIFVPLYKRKWFNDEEILDHHIKTQQAYKDLKTVIGEVGYQGGLLISDSKSLERFLPPFFSLIEGNYFIYGFFYSEKLNVVFSYHYSGELFMYFYTKLGLEKCRSFIEQKNLKINPRYSSL